MSTVAVDKPGIVLQLTNFCQSSFIPMPNIVCQLANFISLVSLLSDVGLSTVNA